MMTFEDIELLLSIDILCSDIPDNMNWVSVDEDGSVYMYEDEPTLHIERIETEPVLTEFYWTLNGNSGEHCFKMDMFCLEELSHEIYQELTSGWETPYHKKLLFRIEDLM